MQLPTEDRWMTAGEVARALGVTGVTLRSWRRKRTGPSFRKIGGRYQYRESVIRQYLRDAEVEIENNPTKEA
jgi:DNA-binding transcriptional MerR regulator